MLDLAYFPYPLPLVLLVGIAITLLISITALAIALFSKKRISKILNGKNSKDIDEVLLHIYKNISTLEQFKSKTTNDIQILNTKSAKAISSVETIRFNPFKGNGTGGNQSFATALIDEMGNGVIISSLYSSDRMSVFAKPILAFKSTFELTEEEAAVLEKAAAKLS